jgi:DoxX-like family
MTSITADSAALDTRVNLGATPRPRQPSTPLWTGRVLSGLGVLFMVFDGGAKVLDLIPPEVKAANSLGWSDHTLPVVGAIALFCTALYLIPRTALLGAILLTGYFGGAIASHLRVDSPLFSHTLFPIYIAALFWAGLFLRDGRVRALFAARSSV